MTTDPLVEARRSRSAPIFGGGSRRAGEVVSEPIPLADFAIAHLLAEDLELEFDQAQA